MADRSIDLVRVSATLDAGSELPLVAESADMLCASALAIFEAHADGMSQEAFGALYLLRQAAALVAELHNQLERSGG